MKQRKMQPAVRPLSSTTNQKTEDELGRVGVPLSKRAGDWLAAGEKLKAHRPQFK